jgi:uncharacterized protein YecE (DUF72 family)
MANTEPSDSKSGNIYTGASGLVLPVRNKLAYPAEFQDKSRLHYYASLFNSIEINTSFYKLPMAATVKKWQQSTPDGFRFTFKLWREITHNKELIFKQEDVLRFLEVVSEAGTKSGCLLIQFPPKTTFDYELQLEQLLIRIKEHPLSSQWKLALEFRHKSWYTESTYELARVFDACIVIQDLPASATPFLPQEAGHVYVRFHGPNGGYRGSYTDDFLYEYSHYIKAWKEEGKEVYAYFNNTMGNAVNNLISLNNFLNKEL